MGPWLAGSPSLLLQCKQIKKSALFRASAASTSGEVGLPKRFPSFDTGRVAF